MINNNMNDQFVLEEHPSGQKKKYVNTNKP